MENVSCIDVRFLNSYLKKFIGVVYGGMDWFFLFV